MGSAVFFFSIPISPESRERKALLGLLLARVWHLPWGAYAYRFWGEEGLLRIRSIYTEGMNE